MRNAYFTTSAVLLAVLLGTGSAGVLHPACGQDAAGPDTTAQATTDGPTPHGRWGVGGVLSPIIGLSLRGALTRRLTVQVGGMPIPGQEFSDVDFEGTVGGRGLYKFFAGSWYNVFASAGVDATFFKTAVGGDGLIERQGWVHRVGWTGHLTVGAEAVFWSRLGISLEVGGAEEWGDPNFYASPVTGGIGVHYYW